MNYTKEAEKLIHNINSNMKTIHNRQFKRDYKNMCKERSDAVNEIMQYIKEKRDESNLTSLERKGVNRELDILKRYLKVNKF